MFKRIINIFLKYEITMKKEIGNTKYKIETNR